MNDIIKHLQKFPNLWIKYNKLDINSLQLTVLSDGSFSGNEDGSSQVEYMIFLTDKYNNANLEDYASMKSRRVVRSVIGAETFALADSCDAAILL